MCSVPQSLIVVETLISSTNTVLEATCMLRIHLPLVSSYLASRTKGLWLSFLSLVTCIPPSLFQYFFILWKTFLHLAIFHWHHTAIYNLFVLFVLSFQTLTFLWGLPLPCWWLSYGLILINLWSHLSSCTFGFTHSAKRLLMCFAFCTTVFLLTFLLLLWHWLALFIINCLPFLSDAVHWDFNQQWCICSLPFSLFSYFDIVVILFLLSLFSHPALFFSCPTARLGVV